MDISNVMPPEFTKSWNYDPKKAVCFTGHRPEKIAGFDTESINPPENIKNFLHNSIGKSIKTGKTLFYTGLAKGVDLWAAREVLDYRKNNKNVFLVGIQPYPEHGFNFGGSWKKVFLDIANNCDVVLTISKNYYKAVFLERDRFMVDHSSKCIAVCNLSDTTSGSYYTLRYAKKLELELDIFDTDPNTF